MTAACALRVHLRVVEERRAGQADPGQAHTLVQEARGQGPAQLGGVDPGVIPDEEARRFHVPRQRTPQSVGE